MKKHGQLQGVEGTHLAEVEGPSGVLFYLYTFL